MGSEMCIRDRPPPHPYSPPHEIVSLGATGHWSPSRLTVSACDTHIWSSPLALPHAMNAPDSRRPFALHNTCIPWYIYYVDVFHHRGCSHRRFHSSVISPLPPIRLQSIVALLGLRGLSRPLSPTCTLFACLENSMKAPWKHYVWEHYGSTMETPWKRTHHESSMEVHGSTTYGLSLIHI